MEGIFVTSSGDVEGTECVQRAGADSLLSMPVCDSTNKIEEVAYGEASQPPKHK